MLDERDAPTGCLPLRKKPVVNHRLLDHRPVIDALAAPRRSAERSSKDEMQEAADLLEHAGDGALVAYLARMIENTAGRHTTRGVSAALAGVLGRAGLPLLRQTSAARTASAGRIFGLELEGLSPEDQAFEVARHFARFAKEAANRAARASGSEPAQVIARRAAAAAATRYAPGLRPTSAGNRPSKGTWFRRGRQIVVLIP